MFNEHFEASLWWKLPRPLKQRWWKETEYGRNPPSQELLQATRALLATENTSQES